mmetsp:Transcript_3591/g.12677  ORF Transcript_3591/g.12677 Transcript_3591/m.12677 type:complete len:861 (-) Transcript_3591:441-3023(-)
MRTVCCLARERQRARNGPLQVAPGGRAAPAALLSFSIAVSARNSERFAAAAHRCPGPPLQRPPGRTRGPQGTAGRLLSAVAVVGHHHSLSDTLGSTVGPANNSGRGGYRARRPHLPRRRRHPTLNRRRRRHHRSSSSSRRCHCRFRCLSPTPGLRRRSNPRPSARPRAPEAHVHCLVRSCLLLRRPRYRRRVRPHAHVLAGAVRPQRGVRRLDAVLHRHEPPAELRPVLTELQDCRQVLLHRLAQDGHLEVEEDPVSDGDAGRIGQNDGDGVGVLLEAALVVEDEGVDALHEGLAIAEFLHVGEGLEHLADEFEVSLSNLCRWLTEEIIEVGREESSDEEAEEEKARDAGVLHHRQALIVRELHEHLLQNTLEHLPHLVGALLQLRKDPLQHYCAELVEAAHVLLDVVTLLCLGGVHLVALLAFVDLRHEAAEHVAQVDRAEQPQVRVHRLGHHCVLPKYHSRVRGAFELPAYELPDEVHFSALSLGCECAKEGPADVLLLCLDGGGEGEGQLELLVPDEGQQFVVIVGGKDSLVGVAQLQLHLAQAGAARLPLGGRVHMAARRRRRLSRLQSVPFLYFAPVWHLPQRHHHAAQARPAERVHRPHLHHHLACASLQREFEGQVEQRVVHDLLRGLGLLPRLPIQHLHHRMACRVAGDAQVPTLDDVHADHLLLLVLTDSEEHVSPVQVAVGDRVQVIPPSLPLGRPIQLEDVPESNGSLCHQVVCTPHVLVPCGENKLRVVVHVIRQWEVEALVPAGVLVVLPDSLGAVHGVLALEHPVGIRGAADVHGWEVLGLEELELEVSAVAELLLVLLLLCLGVESDGLHEGLPVEEVEEAVDDVHPVVPLRSCLCCEEVHRTFR